MDVTSKNISRNSKGHSYSRGDTLPKEAKVSRVPVTAASI